MRLGIAATVLALATAAATACGQTSALHTAAPPSAAPKATAATTTPAASTTAPSPAATSAAPKKRELPQDEHLSQPIAVPKCPHATPPPHFTTPQAMMRYLATAWNENNLDALCHVTNPNARTLLDAMHHEAVNLRLNHCNAMPGGTYRCFLDHDFPTWRHKHGTGQAVFQAAPADTPGWYMTVFESCD
jgi:hypothetical protein